MQSLVSAVLVILIILVFVVIFVPAALERLSKRNRATRDQRAAEFRAAEVEVRALERQVIPYARGKSAHFRDGAAAARERLAAWLAELGASGAVLAEMRCPEVYDYLLPVQHFALSPRDAAAILADRRRLGRLGNRQRAVAAAEAAARAGVAALADLPATLADEQAAAASRLDGVEAALRGERAAGVAELADLEGEAARSRALLTRLPADAASAALPVLDEGAAALEQAAALIAPLEQQIAALTAGRARLDDRLRRVAAELDDLQAGAKAGLETAGPAQLRPVARRAAALLNESAPAHRRQRDFAAAEADAAAAGRLIALARDLTAADARARLLAERDDGVSLAGPIAEARRDLADLLDTAADDRGPSAAREATLVARAAALRRSVEALVERQNEVIAGLERDAAATRDLLAHAWEGGQRLLRLAADDPLARRYARLAADADEARRRTDALAQFQQDAAAFEGILAPWVTRVQAARQRVMALRAHLPELIDAALATAAPWACLADHVNFIQQRAADFETTQAKFAAARRRREAEALMDELEAIEREVDDRYALLTEQAQRLRFLEADVDQIVALAAAADESLPPEDPARIKRERALNLIAHHTTQAHGAARYEDASLALSRAADLANRLAL